MPFDVVYAVIAFVVVLLFLLYSVLCAVRGVRRDGSFFSCLLFFPKQKKKARVKKISSTAETAAAATLAASKAETAKAIADVAAAKIAAKAASDLAAAAYKAEYNALAKKWNAKNPKAKVALKK
jgi:hypothetical protein